MDEKIVCANPAKVVLLQEVETLVESVKYAGVLFRNQNIVRAQRRSYGRYCRGIGGSVNNVNSGVQSSIGGANRSNRAHYSVIVV